MNLQQISYHDLNILVCGSYVMKFDTPSARPKGFPEEVSLYQKIEGLIEIKIRLLVICFNDKASFIVVKRAINLLFDAKLATKRFMSGLAGTRLWFVGLV